MVSRYSINVNHANAVTCTIILNHLFFDKMDGLDRKTLAMVD